MRTVITHFFNEEYLLPFWIKHHREIFDHGILINYKSTDQSVNMIKKYAPSTWEIVDTVNDNFDAQLCDIEVMQHEKNVKGWKIALNITEFFVCPNLEFIEKECEKNGLNGFKTSGVVMVDNQVEKQIDFNIPLIEQKRFGFLEDSFDFKAIKLPWYSSPSRGRIYHKCKTGIYFPGRHKSFLSKIPYTANAAFTMWYGYSPWNQEFLKRKNQISKNIDPEDIKRGWGSQHILDFSSLNEIKNSFLKQSYDLKEILEKSTIKRDSYFSDISNDEVLYDDFGLVNIQIEQLKSSLKITAKNLHNSEKALKEILESKSWKITAPLRFLYRKFLKILNY